MEKLIRIILIIIGTLSVILGIIGIILPVLPTTPFLLVGATCYFKSSKRLYRKLLENKYLGTYIRNYREGKGIPLRAKIIAMILLWAGIGHTIIFSLSSLWLKFLLLIIATAVSWYILSQKNLQIEKT